MQTITLTIDQFRTLAKAVWDEAFTEGHDQGERSTWPGSSISNEIRSGDELWEQSISNDAVEKLILVDNPNS